MTAEPRWRKSRFSGSTGGQCVEVAATGDGLVRVRDSKDPAGPVLVVTARGWRGWISQLRRTDGAPASPGQCLTVAWEGSVLCVRAQGQPAGPVLRFHPAEWAAFKQGVKEGEFDLTDEDRLPPLPGHVPQPGVNDLRR